VLEFYKFIRDALGLLEEPIEIASRTATCSVWQISMNAFPGRGIDIDDLPDWPCRRD
jgi:hypothetical protein